MFTASLTSFEGAWISVAEDSSLLEMAAAGQLIFDLVQLVHFLTIFFRRESVERGLVLGIVGFGTLGNSALDRLGFLLLTSSVGDHFLSEYQSQSDHEHPRSARLVLARVCVRARETGGP